MSTRSTFAVPSSTEAPREDWLSAGIVAGFVATFAMAAAIVAGYLLAAGIGDPAGWLLERWGWALVNNPVAGRTMDFMALAIATNLAIGLILALVYARYVEPRLDGPNWWRGVRFALVPWLLSLVVFLPIMGGGVFGVGLGAGPLPILGNLLAHLVYGAVLGIVYAVAADDWFEDTDEDRLSAAAAKRGAARGVAVGVLVGVFIGWLAAPGFADLASRPVGAIAIAFLCAAIGFTVGAFAGLGRA